MGDESAILTQEDYDALCGFSDALNAAVKKAGYKDMLDFIVHQDVTYLYKRPYPTEVK